MAALTLRSWRIVTENHAQPAGGAQHGAGVERRVRPHRQRPAGPGVPDPGDGLGQERRRAAGRTGVPTPQPGEQHLPGAGVHRQLRVVAQHLGVAVPGTLLAPAVHLHDRRVHIDGHRRTQIGRAGSSLPEPAQGLPRHRVELAHVVPAEGPQPGPDRRRCPGLPEHRLPGTGAQQRGVVDAVPTGQHRPDHRQRLRAAVRAVPGHGEPLLDQPGQVQALGQRRRRQQSSVRHQIRLVETHRDPAQIVRCSHPSDALSVQVDVVRRKTHRPCSEGICTFTARRQTSTSTVDPGLVGAACTPAQEATDLTGTALTASAARLADARR